MRRVKKSRILGIAILTTITVVTWVIFGVYRTLTFRQPTEVPQNILSPLNPNLDLSTLNEVEGRISVTEEEAGRFSVGSSATVPVGSQQEATESGSLTPTPALGEEEQSTPSGQTGSQESSGD